MGWQPFGLLKFKRGKPIAQTLYETAIGLFGDPERGLTNTPGSLVDDLSFAAARMTAFAVAKLDRAGDQQFAAGAYDLLRSQEEEHKITPPPEATIHERKLVLAALMKLPAGAARPELEAALMTLLGDNYVGVHVTRVSERLLFPAALGQMPQNLQLPTVARKLIRVLAPISINLGTAQAIPYVSVDPLPVTGSVHSLALLDAVVLEPEILGRTETVIVSALGTTVIGSNTVPTFTAIPLNAHEPQAWGSTSPFPTWLSSQRDIVIVVKSAAAAAPVMRRAIHELLERMEPSVTTWELVQESAPGTAGPFTLDDPILGLLDLNPLTTVTVP